MILYKVLNHDGTSCNGGSGQWSLPKNGKPGAWFKVKGKLEPCENGIHACRRDQLVEWLGPAIYELEPGSKVLDWGDKVGMRRARLIRKIDAWNERTARLFACDCAERVLPIFERQRPNNTRPREAIRIARLYADGGATENELAAAARAAARAAAGVAEGVAAGDAAWAAAWGSAGDAARAAARDAAWDAAGDAAWAAERTWQTERLFEYLEEKR
jgi:hypothetical protein